MTDESPDTDGEDTTIDASTAERIQRVEEIIRAVERGEMTVREGKEALAEARELIEELQAEFDDEE
jgi:uncharacterized membrane protein YjjP (DUF1212 family)